MKREELQHDFHNEQGINWLNSQGEPDIDYVMWLENKILAIKNNIPLPPAEGAEQKKTCVLCTKPAMDNGLCYEHNVCNVPKQPQPTAEGAEKSCLNCRFHNSPTYHDKMWCRDCQQFNHYEAIKSMAKSAEAILHEHIDKQSMDELSVNVWPDMLEAMTEFAASQRQPQPTAEGADVIASLIESLGEPTEVHNHSYSIRPYTVEGKTEWWMFHDGVGSGEPLAQWLSEFATLHAQQMAKKMVREELIAYDKYASRWIDNYRAETAEDCVDEYLKSKEQ